jgi:hypothetical protein
MKARMRTLESKLSHWVLLGTAFIGAVIVIVYTNNAFYQEFLDTTRPLDIRTIPRDSVGDRAWVEIDFGDGKPRLFAGTMDRQTYTLKTALSAIAHEADFAVTLRNERIETIAGVGKRDGTWNIYYGGEKLEESRLDALLIKAGDRYVLRYQQ